MITEHEMLVTLATMALEMDDLTGHDIVEAFKAHGYNEIIAEARAEIPEISESFVINLEREMWRFVNNANRLRGGKNAFTGNADTPYEWITRVTMDASGISILINHKYLEPQT